MGRTLCRAFAALTALSAAAGFRVAKKKRSACGVKRASINIVNGEDASKCEWPWQAGFRRGKPGKPFCGGSLIAPEWVITAAHCGDFPDFNVTLGDWEPAKPGTKTQLRRAVQLFRHPKYIAEKKTFDIALVRLDRAADLGGDCVSEVCLPEEGVQPGAKCWITGWGTLGMGQGSSDILQEGEVTIISNEDCVEKFSYPEYKIDESMMCAQGRASDGSVVDACRGDSGGPLVCEQGGVWSLQGATSWGDGCAKEDYPGIWSRVHGVRDWIEEVMAANDGPPPPPPEKVMCPDFSIWKEPNDEGDCRCPWGEKCSTDGGVTANCENNGWPEGYGQGYFLPDCKECKCYRGL